MFGNTGKNCIFSINLIAILMMAEKLATPALLKIKNILK